MGPEALIIALRQSEPDLQLSTPKICSMDKRSSLPSSGGLDAKPAAAPPGLSQREATACTGLITEEVPLVWRWFPLGNSMCRTLLIGRRCGVVLARTSLQRPQRILFPRAPQNSCRRARHGYARARERQPEVR